MTDQPLKIGWIGTGVMGAAMAIHLLDAGHELIVHSRTKSKAVTLLTCGASWAETPAEAADGADAAISIVGFPEDVKQVHLGERGTLAASTLPRFIIDMTTSRPKLAAQIADVARKRGVGSVDAPVSGGDIGARNATLSIMVGGDERDVQYVRPILSSLGRQIVHHGPPGAGQHAKMVNQILLATNMIGVCEGLLYATQAGLDALKVIESVGMGAAGSWSINNLGPRMILRDFAPGFQVEHFLKDLRIALEEAENMGLVLPGLALAKQLYLAVKALGLGRSGTQALLIALEQLNGQHGQPEGDSTVSKKNFKSALARRSPDGDD